MNLNKTALILLAINLGLFKTIPVMKVQQDKDIHSLRDRIGRDEPIPPSSPCDSLLGSEQKVSRFKVQTSRSNHFGDIGPIDAAEANWSFLWLGMMAVVQPRLMGETAEHPVRLLSR